MDAGPGTGKTHLLATKAARLVASGIDAKRILVLTFSHRAAMELRERIVHSGGNACEVRTFHGFASRLLEAGGPRFRSRRLLGSFAKALVFETGLRRTELQTLNAATRRSVRFAEDAARFTADLRRNEVPALQSLRDSATPRIADLLRIADGSAQLREGLRASDLDDLIGRAVAALETSESPQARWLAGRYQYLLVDEFQDIDRLQLALCEQISATVFAVGDPSQSIYQFRGAVHGMFADGARRLGLKRFALHYSRRCPQQICDLAAATPLLGATRLESLVDREGSISVLAARTTLDEAALIADRVEESIGSGVPPEKIAVLLRSMRPLARAVCAELRSRRILVAATGSEAFFTDPDVTVLRLALRAFVQPGRNDFWAAFLSAPCLGFDATKLRLGLKLAHFSSVLDFVAWLRNAEPVGTIPLPDLAELLITSSALFEAGNLSGAVRKLIRGFGLIEAQTKFADVVQARASIARLMRFVDALGEAQLALHSLGERASSADIVALIDDHVEELGSDETPNDDVAGVRVLSIHGAKGLQFDLVIIGDAVEGRFPAAARRSTLLNEEDRAVLATAGVDVVDARNDDGLTEEASLWYVAVTRTRDDLVITYATHGAGGSPQRVTRFLPWAMHLDADYVPFERTRERIESTLLQSESVPARDALAKLASESPIVDAMVVDGDAAFATLEQRPVVLERTFSVSAAEEWFYCPRRFFYHHALGLSGDQSNAMRGGTLLHTVLQRFHTEFTSFGPGCSAALGQWKARLRVLREEESAKGDVGPIEVQIARAALSDRLLERYAEALATESDLEAFTVRGVEHSIDVPFPSGFIRGRLDRVDALENGELILRDYKSGKMHGEFGKALEKEFHTTATPIAGNFDAMKFKPQLALYRIGAEKAFDARVARLEYIYLKGAEETFGAARDTLIIDEARHEQVQRLETFVEDGFVRGYTNGSNLAAATALSDQSCRFCDYKRRRLCAGVEG